MTSAAFLIALRGTRVEVHTTSITATGKVFSVETVEKETPSGGTNHVTQLSIVTDSGLADTTPRQVVLEHPIRSGWRLLDDMKPEESSATRYRFRVAVEPGKTERFRINERRLEVSRIYVSNLTDNQLAAYVREGSIKPEPEAELRKVLAKKFEIFNADQDLKSAQHVMESIDKDQSRLRENMKVLKGSAEEKALLQRYTKQLDGEEDRLAALQKEMADLKAKRNQLQSELDSMVMKLTIDETL